MSKKPNGIATNTHLTSIFQKSINQPRGCVGWKAVVMGTRATFVCLICPGICEKPTQKRVLN